MNELYQFDYQYTIYNFISYTFDRIRKVNEREKNIDDSLLLRIQIHATPNLWRKFYGESRIH